MTQLNKLLKPYRNLSIALYDSIINTPSFPFATKKPSWFTILNLFFRPHLYACGTKCANIRDFAVRPRNVLYFLLHTEKKKSYNIKRILIAKIPASSLCNFEGLSLSFVILLVDIDSISNVIVWLLLILRDATNLQLRAESSSQKINTSYSS